ncbi:MAG: phosphoglycerate kinase [Anaerolineae bacterium]|nr:phosphoglycerate kinase [Anaerolineae bacterium]
MNKMTVRDVDVRDRRVLVRVDFNVPIVEGQVTDDTRIRATLPTLRYLLDRGAALILMSHLGRPKNPDPAFSLRPVAKRLSELLGHPVQMAPDCVGPEVEAMVASLRAGQILLLENLRFHPEEEKNDPEFARQLARLGDLCVNDAFGAAHRAHASVAAIARFIPVVAGFLMEKEIRYLSQALTNPGRPFITILGGAKISDKIGVIESLLARADRVLIGGGMANTFLKAQGYAVGDSLVEDEALETARRLLERGGDRLWLPVDVVIADAFAPDAQARVVPIDQVPAGWRILDIGPQTVARYTDEIRRAAFIVWNGPMGVFEFPRFAEGTFAIARAVAESGATSVVGGGDSVAAVHAAGVADRITHISTGGGASLEFLEGRTLPGIAVLAERPSAE